MYHIAGVEVAEALRDVGQLAASISVGSTQYKGHLQVEFGRRRDVSRCTPAGFRQTSNSKRAGGG